MAPPPAKRQKRLVVLSSDDEEGSVTSKADSKQNNTVITSSPTRSRKKSTCAKAAKNKPASSPLTTKNSMQNKTHGTSSRSISSFFSSTGQGQKQTRRGTTAVAAPHVAEQPVEEEEGEEDVIEDISDIDGSGEERAEQDTRSSVLDRRKRTVKLDGNTASSAKQSNLPSGSQKFKVPSSGTKLERDGVKGSDLDQRPWAEKFAPLNLEELAVHKKKVSDVRGWLENVVSGRDRRRLLILKGPAGAGKTAAFKAVAQVMQLDLAEWKNPVGTDYSSEGYMSMSAHFEDFLGRSGKFNRLETEGMPIDGHTMPNSNTPPHNGNDKQKVILLEEFPNTFLSTSTALQSFRSSVLQHLAANTPSLGAFYTTNALSHAKITPVVMIITETRLTSATASSDTFTVHRLLGSDILNHPAVTVIEFNPVATTFIRKALDLVILKEARHSGRRRVPGPSVLRTLCEVGDVRSAIGTLEFLCVRAQDSDDWGGRVVANAKRGANATTSLTKMEKDSLEIVAQRENSLGLFHAVGKVVYNKRDGFTAAESTMELPVHPPDHLQDNKRSRVPQTSVDQLIDETGTDTETFIAALHENYVMSCEGPGFADTLDGCLGALSDGDLLGSRSGRSRGTGVSTSCGTASESLRQDEIAFQLVVRGLLFALPDPVKRSSHPTDVSGRRGGKGDSHKMFYPVSMRLFRQMEEMEHSLDQWHKRLKNATATRSQPISEGSPLFESNRPTKHNHPAAMERALPREHKQDEPVPTSLNCTKAELILERLPYITKIERANPASGHLRELEDLTQFHGIDVPDDDTSDEENVADALLVGAWTGDGAAHTIPMSMQVIQKSGKEAGKEAFKGVIPVEEEVEKLYLTDDDIED